MENELQRFRQEWLKELVVGEEEGRVVGVPHEREDASGKQEKPETGLESEDHPAISTTTEQQQGSGVSGALGDAVSARDAEEEAKRAEAIEMFLKAGRCERKGKMIKAVRLYRRSFKLYPELEEVSIQKALALSEKEKEDREREEASSFIPSQPMKRRERRDDEDDEEEGEREEEEAPAPLPSWALAFRKAVAGKAQEQAGVHVAALPNEVLYTIFSYLVSVPPTTLEATSAVCRQWFVLSREPSLWRTACDLQWPLLGVDSMAVQVHEKLGGDWRRCYLSRPRPRCDGIYVSRNTYVRQGMREGAFYDPIYEVKYWRFLRFYPSGVVLSLSSPDKKAAKMMHLELAKKQAEVTRLQERQANRRGRQAEAPGAASAMETIEIGSYAMLDDSLEALVELKLDSLVVGKHVNCMRASISNSNSGGWLERLRVQSYHREMPDGRVSVFEPDMIATYKFLKLPKSFLEYVPLES